MGHPLQKSLPENKRHFLKITLMNRDCWYDFHLFRLFYLYLFEIVFKYFINVVNMSIFCWIPNPKILDLFFGKCITKPLSVFFISKSVFNDSFFLSFFHYLRGKISKKWFQLWTVSNRERIKERKIEQVSKSIS